jgi:hypothetical protein
MIEDELLFEVFAPDGAVRGPAPVRADRLTQLAGKRVGFLWDHMFRGEEMFQEIAAYLSADHGAVTVAHEAFGNIHGENEAEVLAALPEVLRAERVDAVISAVGA